jgi:ribosomal protein S18 acetylase RimI-like enzyme
VTDRDRAVAFLRETYRRRVERVEYFPWGELLATPSMPRVWDANFAVVDRWEGTAQALSDEMDSAQHAAGFDHRRVVMPDDHVAARLWPGILELEWEFSSRYLLMAQTREPDRPADPSVEVLGVGDVDWARGRQSLMESELYGEDAELVQQLIELDRRLQAHLDVRHLAAVIDGDVVSYAALYLEREVAQIEDVATLPAFRNRGLARAVVLRAADEARRAGAQIVFLVTSETDWPQQLYRKLGFDEIAVEHIFGRPGRHHSPA